MLYIAIAVISKSLTFLVLISCLLPTSTLFPYTTLFRSYQRTQRFWKDQFARRVRFDVGDDARPRILTTRLRRAKFPGRDVQERCADRLALRAHRAEINRLARLEQLRIDGCARRDDAHDFASHQLIRF